MLLKKKWKQNLSYRWTGGLFSSRQRWGDPGRLGVHQHQTTHPSAASFLWWKRFSSWIPQDPF